MGLLVFLLIATVSAVAWHRLVPRYTLASFGAAFTSAAAFQLAAFFHLGYLDAFFLIAAVTSAVVAFIIALLVGLPIRARRKHQQEGAANAL